MQVNLRNRIAGYYVFTTGILIAGIFLLLYYVIAQTMYAHLDEDLTTESTEVFKSIVVLSNQFVFANPYEWKEGEHKQVEVNPTFIQVVDTAGNFVRKSENLFSATLSGRKDLHSKVFYSTTLSNSSIRQLQMPIVSTENKILGYLLIAVPLSEVEILLHNLQILLVIVYPITLFLLFILSRFIAGKSISPVNKVISTAEHITKENLEERIELPQHKDELYRLTATINQLLDRLQDTVVREQQFTSDASHELRTPLTSIKGTLEVLIRKPRTAKQYAAKIAVVITEVNRLSHMVEQLLTLARYENHQIQKSFTRIHLPSLIQNVLNRMENEIEVSQMKIRFKNFASETVEADEYMTGVMIENIVANALKYSKQGSNLTFSTSKTTTEILCSISDKGLGISEEQLPYIFDRFYRTDESRTSSIPGTGLGLAIVKKFSDVQSLPITVESEIGIGTTFTIHFPKL